jgi:threonine dehydrogenase-like Zn-dependent dehydrogenase
MLAAVFEGEGRLAVREVPQPRIERDVVSEVSPFRQEMARASGATDIVDPQRTDLQAFVEEHTGGGADVVVDAVGSLLPLAVDLVRPRGMVVLFGMNHQAIASFPQYLITRKEIAVSGSYIAHDTFPLTVQIIESGRLPLDRLITHRIALQDLQNGLEMLRRGEAMKVIINQFGAGTR